MIYTKIQKIVEYFSIIPFHWLLATMNENFLMHQLQVLLFILGDDEGHLFLLLLVLFLKQGVLPSLMMLSTLV